MPVTVPESPYPLFIYEEIISYFIQVSHQKNKLWWQEIVAVGTILVGLLTQ